MNGRAYYNEIEPYAADWLERLIAVGHIAAGDVDRRSIVDVRPDDLRGYTQCHFFAGIGGWSLALRLAGWADDRFAWTGSCPCQPFSAAGKQRGSDDERHLWPAWFRLISECRPGTVFGEQVAGAAGRAWLDHVLADLEGRDYAAAAAIVPACGVGAPHIRERMWFVAHAENGDGRRGVGGAEAGTGTNGVGRRGSAIGGADGRMADAGRSAGAGVNRILAAHPMGQGVERPEPAHSGADGRMADADGRIARDGDIQRSGEHGLLAPGGGTERMADADQAGRSEQRIGGLLDGERAAFRADASTPWADLEWLACSDGKARPTQPGLFPLVAGLPKGMVRGGDPGAPINANESAEGRVGRLRGYGNSIVPQVAAEFIGAFADARMTSTKELQ